MFSFSAINNFIDWVKHSVYYPFKQVFTANQRKLLIFLMLLLAILSISQSGFSIYLATLFYDKRNASSIITWMGLAIEGICLLVTCIVGIRGAQAVNLDLLLSFFWGIMVFIAPLLMAVVGCLNFYLYINIYFKYEWGFESFRGLRELFCEPKSTANTKCMAPISGGSHYTSVEAWCLAMYNATDCMDIRANATRTAVNWGSRLILTQASVGVTNLVLIGFTIFICYRILTAPVITESMNDVINYLLLLPIGGCAGMGLYMQKWQYYKDLPYFWSSKMFFIIAGSQAFAIPLGVQAGRLKSAMLMSGYILLMTLILVGLIALGAYGLLYAALIPHTFKPPTAELSMIACDKGLPGCCCCNNTAISDRCPEWSEADVISLLVLDLKLAGTVAFISLLYLLGAQVVALLIRNGLRNYKTDYI